MSKSLSPGILLINEQMQVVLTNPHTGAALTAIVVQSLSDVATEQKQPGALFYQLADRKVYQWFDTDGTMHGIGGFFGKIMGIAAPFANFIPGVGQFVAAGLGVASSLIAGKPGQARGLSEITAFGNQVLAGFDTLEGQLNPQTAVQIAAEADKLVAVLSDSNAVYQAKKGKDAEALANFKSQAQQRAASLKARAAELASQPPAQQPSNAVAATNSAIPAGSIATYAVAGLAAFLILRKLL